MRDLLFLTHRMPYPPDKGDKIRSWNFLHYLTQRYRVHLGCFIDDARDWQFELVLRGMCGECCFVALDRKVAAIRSASALWKGLPVTLPYYGDPRLASWIQDLVRRQPIEAVFVYCSAMAQYVERHPANSMRRIVDLVDLDSQKWLEYSRRAAGLKRWVFNREARLLAKIERQVAEDFDATVLSTAAETEEFAHAMPALRSRIYTIRNGVDCEYFSPEHQFDNPYEVGRVPIVFTGAMDYWPNIDAVTYFVNAIFPSIREHVANAMLVIVGANPHTQITALADGKNIVVTGRVVDVRPYTAHARAIVAPLRIARGIQNKVLEGMAMAKPVVASPEAMVGIDAEIGTEVLVAADSKTFAAAVIDALLGERGGHIGINARRRVLASYTWAPSLLRMDKVLAGETLDRN